MFQHVARFAVPLAGPGSRDDQRHAVWAFVTPHTYGATYGGGLFLSDRMPGGISGTWPWAEALSRKVRAVEKPTLEPVAVLSGGRILFLLSGYQDVWPSCLSVPVLFDPRAKRAFVPLTRSWGRSFPLGRVTARRFYDLPDGQLALTTETRASHMIHVESDESVEGVCRLDLTRGSIQTLDRLPPGALPHDSGLFQASGFRFTISDEHLLGPPPWGREAEVRVSDGHITVTPAHEGKPQPELALRGPCANPHIDSESVEWRVRASRHGRSLLVLDGTPEDSIVVDIWEIPGDDSGSAHFRS